jgi:hypothetical protein
MSKRKVLLFLKKKKQKDFASLARALGGRRARKLTKVFCFFFPKKQAFPCLISCL